MLILTSRLNFPPATPTLAYWLQVRDMGEWSVVCSLTRTEASDTLRWLDRHPTRRELRVLVERVS